MDTLSSKQVFTYQVLLIANPAISLKNSTRVIKPGNFSFICSASHPHFYMDCFQWNIGKIIANLCMDSSYFVIITSQSKTFNMLNCFCAIGNKNSSTSTINTKSVGSISCTCAFIKQIISLKKRYRMVHWSATLSGLSVDVGDGYVLLRKRERYPTYPHWATCSRYLNLSLPWTTTPSYTQVGTTSVTKRTDGTFVVERQTQTPWEDSHVAQR
jgi:hypothetical protein